jgi:uncharacterized protein (DUF2141 family)
VINDPGLVRLTIPMLFLLVAQQGVPRAVDNQIRLGTASIAGIVVDARDQPLPRVRVQINGEERVTYTDAKGRFLFPRLPAASYQLSAQSAGYLTSFYRQKKFGQSGIALVVGEGEQCKDIRLIMRKAGVVAGHVVDEDGRPMVGTRVSALRMRWRSDGTREFDSSFQVVSDDRGDYRLFDVLPGNYVIAAIPPRVTGSSSMERAVGLDPIQPLVTDGYAPIYFPGVTTPRDATPLEIEADHERAGVDFQLRPIPLFRVRGSIVGSVIGPVSPRTGRPDTGYVELREFEEIAGASLNGGDERRHSAVVASDGRFVFEAVPPGRYEALFSQGVEVQSLYGNASVTVEDHDVSEVAIQARRGVTVSGVQDMQGAGVPDAYPAVVLTPLDGAMRLDNRTVTGKSDPSGHFSIVGVPPGRYAIGSVALPPTWYQSAVAQAGVPSIGRLIQVETTDISDVHVTYRAQAAELSGTMSRSNSEPTSDYTLVVFPADRKYWPMWMVGTKPARPDSVGRYSVTLRPGSYFVAAVEDVAPNQWMDPGFLESLVRSATRVTLVDGQRLVQDFTVK